MISVAVEAALFEPARYAQAIKSGAVDDFPALGFGPFYLIGISVFIVMFFIFYRRVTHDLASNMHPAHA